MAMAPDAHSSRVLVVAHSLSIRVNPANDSKKRKQDYMSQLKRFSNHAYTLTRSHCQYESRNRKGSLHVTAFRAPDDTHEGRNDAWYQTNELSACHPTLQ